MRTNTAIRSSVPRRLYTEVLGGKTITNADELGTAIRSHSPGDRVSVTWVNASGSHSATVTLAGVNP